MPTTASRLLIALGLVSIAGLVGSPALAASSPTPTSSPSTSSSTTSSPAATPKGKAAPVTFGVQPYEANAKLTPAFFSFNVTPGAHASSVAAVLNFSTKPLTLAVATADAANTATGGFALDPVVKSKTAAPGVGDWLSIPPKYTTVTVPGRKSPTSAAGRVLVPLSLVVPTNASPGTHAGGVVVTLKSSVKSESGQLFHLNQRVGSRAFVRVSGAIHPALKIEGLAASYHGVVSPVGKGSAVVTYTVKNTGNVVLGGHQAVTVKGWLGGTVTATKVVDVPVLIPGGSAPFRVVVDGVTPSIWAHATVTVSPLVLPGAVDPGGGLYSASVGFWAIPWTLLAIVVVLLLLLGLYVWRRRRPKRVPGSHSTGTPRPELAHVAAGDGEEVTS